VSLTNRLLAFFLILLALVLASFSLTLYLLAREYLHGIVADRLDAALDTLAAAAEVRPDGVEWEPAERQLRLGPARAAEAIVWTVSDPSGTVIDRSADPMPAEAERNADLWQFRQRWVDPGAAGGPAPKSDDKIFPRLSLVVGSSLEPVRTTLRWLASTMAVLSVAIWTFTLIAGRAVCRRALLPVRRMAEATRTIDVAELASRLPIAGTGDELDDLGRGFNDLLARLEESFERQRRFTAEASHQLRTPLAALLGQIEVILRRERAADEYAQTLLSVHQQGERLAKIVESLLFLARADADARAPGLVAVELRGWLAMHLATWSHHPRFADIAPQVDGAGSHDVFVQPFLLGELSNILLDNACKFSRPGTSIVVRLRDVGGRIELSVEDRGPGIAAADLPHLFTPFYRSAEARLRGIEGVGLGLAIARRIATAFGGTIDAQILPVGVRFRLMLPRFIQDLIDADI
jgi:two-component system, OmpR family, sensor kinase